VHARPGGISGLKSRTTLLCARDRVCVPRRVGILGMRERAVALGGTLSAAPSLLGFRVEAGLPYKRP
jgi:hypothetical protein